METSMDIALEMDELESAEDFFEYFKVDYEPELLAVCRLHILQRFHDYVKRRGEAQAPDYALFRECLARAYQDFVESDVLTEKVFSVFKRAAGIATVPISAIKRARP